jgi:transposase-like protein
MLERQTVPITCPKCATEFHKTLGWLRSHPEFVCSRCGKTIQVDRDRIIRGLQRADKVVDRVRAAIRRAAERLKPR